MSAIHPLAQIFLRDRAVHHGPEIDPRRRDQALAACAVGCDHLEGEELVAIIDDTRRAGVFTGAVITSRRYAWRNMSERGELRWEDLAHVEIERGVLLTCQRCVLAGGETVRVPPTSADTTRLFNAIVKLSRSDRITGARSPSSSRHAARDALFARQTQHGRGQHFGAWLSPAAPNDLARAFAILLGAPTGAGAHGEHSVCDFVVSDAWLDHVGLDASPVSLRTMQAAGYAQRVSGLRVVAKPLWPGCAFSVFGLLRDAPASSLSAMNPALLAALFTELAHIEKQLASAPPAERPSAPAHA